MNCREQDQRTALLLGCGGVERLRGARVAVFGIGGVGGYVCEALARAGVGALDLFDSDTVSLSNLNRQIVALHSTVGKLKTEVMRERISDINPDCAVRTFPVFYLPENAEEYPLGVYDYIADAVDTVAAKTEICVRAKAAGVPVISAMGAGNKLDPTRFSVTDLFRTEGCPLARVMRRELRARGVNSLKVVFSPEPAVNRPDDAPEAENQSIITGGSNVKKRSTPGSVSFVPSVAGLIMAGEIVRDLMNVQHLAAEQRTGEIK